VNSISIFLKDQAVATAIEHGLIAAGMSLPIIAAVNGLGSKSPTEILLDQQLADVILARRLGRRVRNTGLRLSLASFPHSRAKAGACSFRAVTEIRLRLRRSGRSYR
jgi:pilus assembly protein Flp/PilA